VIAKNVGAGLATTSLRHLLRGAASNTPTISLQRRSKHLSLFVCISHQQK
jgi:hypothetical protein